MGKHGSSVAVLNRKFDIQCQRWGEFWNSEIEGEAQRVVAAAMQNAPWHLRPWKSPFKSEAEDEEEPFDDPGLDSESDQEDSGRDGVVSEGVSHRFRFDLESVLKKNYLSHPILHQWFEETPLPNKSAGRAFLTHKFFALVETVSHKEGVVMEFFAEYAHSRFSPQVAATIECNDKDRLRDELWPDFVLWLFRSLKNAERAVLWDVVEESAADPNETEELPDQPVEAEEESVGSDGFWWDPQACPLVRLMEWEGLKQSRGDRQFLANAFISSPVGRLLRANGIAKLEYLEVQKTEKCSAHLKVTYPIFARDFEAVSPRRPDEPKGSSCEHVHTFIKTLYCSCEQCHENQRTPWRRRWLIAQDKLESVEFESEEVWVCAKCRYIVGVDGQCPQCRTKAKKMMVFRQNKESISRDDSVKNTEGKQTSYDDVLLPAGKNSGHPDQQAQAQQRRLAHVHQVVTDFYQRELVEARTQVQTAKSLKRQQSALNRLLVLGALTDASLPEAVREPSSLPDGWQLRFYENLTEREDVAEFLPWISASTEQICNELGTATPTADLSEGNFKVIKHRLKTDWETFVKTHVPKDGETHE